MLGFARKMLHGLNSNILSLASYSRKGPLRGTYARLLCGRIPLHTRRNLPIPADTRRYLPIPTDTHRYPLIPADTLGRYLGLVRDFFEAFSILPDGLTDTQTHTHTHMWIFQLVIRCFISEKYLTPCTFPSLDFQPIQQRIIILIVNSFKLFTCSCVYL